MMQLMPKSKHRPSRRLPPAAQQRTGTAPPGPRTPTYVDPILIVFQERPGDRDSPVVYHVFPKGYSAGEYGLMMADLIRHISDGTGADRGEIMRLMMAEYLNPTTEITGREIAAEEIEGRVFGVPDKKNQQ